MLHLFGPTWVILNHQLRLINFCLTRQDALYIHACYVIMFLSCDGEDIHIFVNMRASRLYCKSSRSQSSASSSFMWSPRMTVLDQTIKPHSKHNPYLAWIWSNVATYTPCIFFHAGSGNEHAVNGARTIWISIAWRDTPNWLYTKWVIVC